MKPNLYILGMNHLSAPVHLREQFALDDVRKATLYNRIQAAVPDVTEAVILSTCNRVELYFISQSADAAVWNRLESAVSAVCELSWRPPATAWYRLSEDQAVDHLLRVASGLDSALVGEPHILGQVSTAFNDAETQHASGPRLRLMFRHAIRCGKRVQTETEIGRSHASIPHAAVQRARSWSANWPDVTALVVGAGKMGRQITRALVRSGVTSVRITSRTAAHAARAARALGVEVVPWTALADSVADHDVIFTAAAAGNHLFTTQRVAGRPNAAPLLFVDVAVPRNVAADVGRLAGVTIFDIDDFVSGPQAPYRAALDQAEGILRATKAELAEELCRLRVQPVIAGMHLKADEIRQKELARARPFFEDVDPEVWQQIQRFSKSLVKKILHEPSVRLRQEAHTTQAAQDAAALRHLFALAPPADDPSDA